MLHALKKILKNRIENESRTTKIISDSLEEMTIFMEKVEQCLNLEHIIKNRN